MGKHLKRLADYDGGRVFDIEKLPDGKFRIWEECDHYFYLDFTAEELRHLAGEIYELSHQ